MFRKIAIALLAASVLAAPAMAQTTMHGKTSKATSTKSETKPETAADTLEKTDKISEKAEKSAENSATSDKATTKHRRMARNHHRGTKTAKLMRKKPTKTAMHGKHHGGKGTKVAKGKTSGRHIYGSAKKSGKMTHHHLGSKPMTTQPSQGGTH
jgi:hypothetical protein